MERMDLLEKMWKRSLKEGRRAADSSFAKSLLLLPLLLMLFDVVRVVVFAAVAIAVVVVNVDVAPLLAVAA
eukprot:scaffold562316_cov41-Prasinocladus_malaysianus.AAC.1